MDRILTLDEVLERIGVSNTTLWRMEGRGDFPARRRISPNRVGWLASEVEAWIQARPTIPPKEG